MQRSLFISFERATQGSVEDPSGGVVGKLFYLIGASGVGKDSLIHYARQNLEGQHQVMFAHRYITRAQSAKGENHIALSEREWHERQQLGLFALSWQSHGYYYGIGIEIEQWLERGINVVVNGSREYLPEASRLYSNLVPVLVQASADKLRERLLARGRECSDSIESRLQRAQLYDGLDHPRLIRLTNNGLFETCANRLMVILKDHS